MRGKEKVRVLEIKLDKILVGYLASYNDGLFVFTFAHSYIEQGRARPTYTLAYYNQPEEDIFRDKIVTNFKLPPVLSNLLPEKDLRKMAAQNLKVAEENEFELLRGLGKGLPGAIIARELTKKEIPPYVLEGKAEIAPPESERQLDDESSLAGIMMKFSIEVEDNVHRMAKRGHLGNWIVKTPTLTHKHLPTNEFTSMKLAEAVGIKIPEIQLIKMKAIKDLPDLRYGDEEYAYAIKRFDRNKKARVHTEDFAQVLDRYPKDKYGKFNYATIANVIKNVFPNTLENLHQFYARLVVNLMIGNGDAHLKNWSVLYSDGIHPELSPAYDIVFTRAFTKTDTSIAFNVGGEKDTSKLALRHFERMTEQIDLDWKLVRDNVLETIETARERWPVMLNELPMAEDQKKKLIAYWKTLGKDFRIG